MIKDSSGISFLSHVFEHDRGEFIAEADEESAVPAGQEP